MRPLALQPDDVRRHTSDKVYPRAVAYAADGRVLGMVRRGDELAAEVAGSDDEPYQVRVRVGPMSGVADVSCTCPYGFEGWCKHVAAVLLAAIDDPDAVPEAPPLADRLAALGADALAGLLLDLIDADPAVAWDVEALLGGEPLPRRDPFDEGDGWE